MVNDKAFTSSFTDNLPAILTQNNLAILMSTYQANRLIVLRVKDDTLNTHFLEFDRPTGLAASNTSIAVGHRLGIRQYAAAPAAINAMKTGADAVYMERKSLITGAIDIHEMAWAGNELWAVNTRFSCLCTFDGIHSFVPRWTPPFIDQLSSGDQCHLNGLAMENNAPALVSALGVSSSPSGWRENKQQGGVIMRVSDGAVIADGLCMPHSPRIVGNRVFFLESGQGTLSELNFTTQHIDVIATLPGFTRGLTVIGNYAFVGLSKVRESAIFGGLPITSNGTELICGLAVIDLTQNSVISLLRFDGDVAEIFAVEAVANCQIPEFLETDGPSEIVANTFIVPSA